MPKTCGVFKPPARQKSLHSEFATFSIGLSSRGLSAIESRQGLTFKCFFLGGHGTKWLRASCPPKSPSFTSENMFFESPKPFQPRWSLKLHGPRFNTLSGGIGGVLRRDDRDEDGPFGPVHLRYGCEY